VELEIIMMQSTQLKLPIKQKGLVLFVALIALLAMSLAAAALIRSVDTSTMVAGNLAFKQSATLAADYGIESAFSWISSNPAKVDDDHDVDGYHSTMADIDFKDEDNWKDAESQPASGNAFEADGKDPLTGNTVRYIVQRMCKLTGPANSTHCLFGSGTSKTSSQGGGENADFGAIIVSSLSPMYRVTARVVGPKNTVSYVQAYLN
jgi:type IV pilus assembly protein PilX